jgi:hypothetical protein
MNGGPSTYRDVLAHPCWYCQHWGGVIYGIHGRCVRVAQEPHVQAEPSSGCAFFEKEPGVDCEEWRPVFTHAPQLRQ